MKNIGACIVGLALLIGSSLVTVQARGSENAPAVVSADPCEDLTNESIQAVIDMIASSEAKAQEDVDQNGVNGAYASATHYNLEDLTAARGKMQALLDWLHSVGVLGTGALSPTFVTNMSGAYAIHGYIRETVVSLEYAQHWAVISVVYHRGVAARDSYELNAKALDLVVPLGAQAGRCYMKP